MVMWEKIIGGAIGSMGGPIEIGIGAIIGHQFDRSASYQTMITDYRKYLLVGPSCSGKSVLLASILSNLEKDPASIWPNFKQDEGLSFKVYKYGDDVAPSHSCIKINERK